jgi:hypothetical protein
MRRFLISALLAIGMSAFSPNLAVAHALLVDCNLRDGKVEVEAFYDDDTPAPKARVKVVNAEEQVVAGGETDQQGRWSFAMPAPGKYVVVVNAGAGHRKEKTIEVPARPDESMAPKNEAPIGGAPKRGDLTRIPWLKIAIGLAIIGGLAGAFLLASMMRKNAKTKDV